MITKNVGETVNFIDNSTDASITSRAWDFGDGSTGSGQQTTHVYTAPGTYTVKLTLYNNNGSTVCTTQQITIVAPSVLSFIEIPSNRTMKQGDTYQIVPICKDQNGNAISCGTLRYIASNPESITVSPSGLITVLSNAPLNIVPTIVALGRNDQVTSNDMAITVIAACVPNWQCIIPLNGSESDGCGHTRLNSACNPCTPNWVCRQPLDGYEIDGCGNQRLNSACNPCAPNWQCVIPLNGYESDGCGHTRLNSACNPPPGTLGLNITADPNPITEAQTSIVKIQVLDSNGAGIGGATLQLSVNGGSLCTNSGITDSSGIFKCKFTPPQTTQNETFTVSVIASKSGYTNGNGSVNIQVTDIIECTPNWQCELPLNGYEKDGCGNRRLNSACNPCMPNWQCEQPLNGWEKDGCGNRRQNSACNPQRAPQDYIFIIAIVAVAAILMFMSSKK